MYLGVGTSSNDTDRDRGVYVIKLASAVFVGIVASRYCFVERSM